MSDDPTRAALRLGTDVDSARTIALGLATLLRRRGARGFVVLSLDGDQGSTNSARDGVVSALVLSGLDVAELGPASSDAVLGVERAIGATATAHLASDGAGGAHLFVRIGGAPLSASDADAVRAIAAQGDFAAGEGTLVVAAPHAAVDAVRAAVQRRDARPIRRERPRAAPSVDDDRTGLVRASFLDEDTAVDG